MKKLPIGIQDFRELREGGYIYVDKTEYVHRLATEGKYYFLSRPRRFGKSLLVNTLAELFEGSRELFEGLWIEDQWDWEQRNPVIQLGFSSMGYKTIGLEEAIYRRLQEEGEKHGISLEKKGYDAQLKELVLALSEKHGKVVLLIDEYDKPIIDYLEDVSKAEANRDVLKTFYSVLKDLDPHIRLVFITGVSKFSRVSIFSELNNLLDLTMIKACAPMLGYTQEELESGFADRIERLAPDFGGEERLLEGLRDWYNGYAWSNGRTKVYNPFSILSFFQAEAFDNFWFTSGTPTFLIKLLKERELYELDDIELDDMALESFDLANIAEGALLFQTGYITIKERLGFGLYRLGYPNKEVRKSMLIHLVTGYREASPGTGATPILRMTHALEQGKIEQLPVHINALLGSIPYNWHQPNEAYYHTIMHLAFSLIGVHIRSEVHASKGELDSVVHTSHTVYVLELKIDKSAEAALTQIKEKGYGQGYIGQGKPVVAVGINFSSKQREVDDWKVKGLG